MALPIDRLSQVEEAKWKELFDSVDSDHDGQISTAEVQKVAAASGHSLSDADAKKFVEAADTDKSGKVSWQEFSKALVIIGLKLRLAMFLTALFRELDVDGSGQLTKEDLFTLVRKAGAEDQITPDQITKLITKMDTDGDGKVSLQEFFKFFLKD